MGWRRQLPHQRQALRPPGSIALSCDVSRVSLVPLGRQQLHASPSYARVKSERGNSRLDYPLRCLNTRARSAAVGVRHLQHVEGLVQLLLGEALAVDEAEV